MVKESKFDRRRLGALFVAGAVSCAKTPLWTRKLKPTGFPLHDREPLPPLRATEDYPWQSDQGDGTFQNPVIFGDYSDPDVIRVGDEYYLIASSFNCTPGLPILRSRDLVNWTLIGHALENLPDPRYEEVRHGEGIWAPAIREHAGIFYIFAPTPDEGIYVLTAKHPAGPWSPPRMLIAGKGLIDPCPLWDDDGKAYLVHAYARSRAGIKNRLRVRPMSPDATQLLGEGEIVFHDPEHQPTIEGPKFHKKDGYYYILAPAGGVKHGWQLALRSRSIYGPYEAMPVLQQGSTAINGPHQGALVDTTAGQWWFVHFQDAGIYGRIVHLNPVRWQDGWPLMGTAAPGSPVREPLVRTTKPKGLVQPIAAPETSDEFVGRELGLQWQWHANHHAEWASLGARSGYLRLFAQVAASQVDFLRVPNLLLQKLPAASFRAETEIEIGGAAGLTRAGLIVMGQRPLAITLERAGAAQQVSLLVSDATMLSESVPIGKIRLAVSMAQGGMCRFFFRTEAGPETPLGDAFQAEAGKWIGAKVGLFALANMPGNFADLAYFRFSKS